MDFLQRNKIPVVLLALNFVGIVAAYLFSYTIIADNMEHLRASYLVSLGYVPYLDFFEHHHPLLWYLWAPIIAHLSHHAVMIFYAAKFLALLFSVLTFGVIYRIVTEFLGTKKLFLFFAVIVSSFFPLWFGVSLFKPDAFARFFYVLAVYLFFRYLKAQQRRDLIYCGVSLAVAFLFVQTIIFEVLPLVLVGLFFCFFRKNFIKDGLLAFAVVFVFLAGFVCWLYFKGLITAYFQLNWIYNTKLFQNIYQNSTSVMGDWVVVIFMALISFGVMLKKRTNVYWKIIGFLFCCQIVQHCVFAAIYPHYLINLLILAALLLAQAFTLITDKTVRGYIWIFLFLSSFVNFFTLYQYNNISFMKFYARLNSSSDFLILNSSLNIYAPKISYYDMFSRDFALLDDCLFHRYPDYDVNKVFEGHQFGYIWREDLNQPLFEKCPAERFILKNDYLQQYKKFSDKVYRRI